MYHSERELTDLVHRVQAMTGRKVESKEFVILEQADLAALTDNAVTDTIYAGTFQSHGKDLALIAHFNQEYTGARKMIDVAGAAQSGSKLENIVFTYIEAAGASPGDIQFAGYKMTLSEHTYGPELVASPTDFSNGSWVAGTPGDWTLDNTGAQHDDAASGADPISSELLAVVTPGKRYRIAITTTGLTTGQFQAAVGDTNETNAIVTSETNIQIVQASTDTNIIAIQATANCNGKIVSVSVKEQLT